MAITEKLLDAAGILARLESPARAVAVIGVAALPMILVVGPATLRAGRGWRGSLSEVVELYFQIVLIGSGVALIANAGAGSAPWRFDIRRLTHARVRPAHRRRGQLKRP